jgi:hypothetical protein
MKRFWLVALTLTLLLSAAAVSARPAPEGTMGMRIESASEEKDAITVVTTGAKFIIRPNGVISGWQRIPRLRKVLDLSLPASALPCHLKEKDDLSSLVACEGGSLELHDDSVVILRTDKPLAAEYRGWFKPSYHFEKDGKWLLIDPEGGFGVYPVAKKHGTWPDLSKLPWNITYHLKAGDEVWLSVFPPRPYNRQRAFEQIDHESGVLPTTAADRDAMDKLIASSAERCKVFTLHADVWQDAPEEFKLKTGLYAGHPQPFVTPKHVPTDLDEFRRVRDEVHQHGMKLVVYLSPYYSKAPDIIAEMKRVLAEYQVDGLYFDGISFDFRKSYDIMRKAREILGNDRILYVHASEDPLDDIRIYCPFIDTYADYILRGEAGRHGLSLDTFLRYTVSGYNISNAVGYWCYYGSNRPYQNGDPADYVSEPPTNQDIDAALRNEVHLWPYVKSPRFQKYYYGKLDALRKAQKH